MNTFGVQGLSFPHTNGITRDLQIDRIENLRCGMVKSHSFYIESFWDPDQFIFYNIPNLSGLGINSLLHRVKQSKSEYMSWNCPVIPRILSTFFISSEMLHYAAAAAAPKCFVSLSAHMEKCIVWHKLHSHFSHSCAGEKWVIKGTYSELSFWGFAAVPMPSAEDKRPSSQLACRTKQYCLSRLCCRV